MKKEKNEKLWVPEGSGKLVALVGGQWLKDPPKEKKPDLKEGAWLLPGGYL